MKILSLLVVLIFCNCCFAATNRSSMWLLANSQIFTTSSPNTQGCQISLPSITNGALTATSSISLLTTSNLAITGTFVQLGSAITADNYITASTYNAILNSLTIQFIYNSSYYIQLNLASNTAQSAAMTVANLFDKASTYFVPYVSGTSSTIYPIFFGTNSIISPTGTTWISVQSIPTLTKASTPWSSGILITDYISLSTIAITQFTDADAAITPGKYNAFYQIGVRTQTSKISSTGTLLTTTSGCTASAGRKRSVDHLIQKRAVCTTATSIDPTMTSSILSTACTAVTNVFDTTLGAASTSKTKSDLGTAFLNGVTAMNALYQMDSAVFSAGGSKYTTAVNFGFLIAISSIFFSL